MPEIPPPKLLANLRGFNLLPAIVFMPTRRRCDEAALEVGADKTQHQTDERADRRSQIFESFLKENPEVKNHKHRKLLVTAGVASHHAGHIPSWKLLVEKMMSEGLLDAIFATSTVAAGVDFPARTVVILNADVRGNDGWRALQASELQQMTGRAGRRGKDNVGFVILAPSNFQDPIKIATLLKARPNPLESQFRSTYTSLLNLLDAFKSFEQVREIAERSFAFKDTAKQIERLENRKDEILRSMSGNLRASGVGVEVSSLIAFERLQSIKNRLEGRLPVTRAELRALWLKENVRAGRVVTKGKNNSRLFIVLKALDDRVLTMREDGDGVSLSHGQIGRVFENQYRFDDQAIERAFMETHEGANPPIAEPRFDTSADREDEAVAIIETCISKLKKNDGTAHAQTSIDEIFWGSIESASEMNSLDLDISNLREGIWSPFQRRARVLSHFGYLLIEKEDVTETGKWLADLRVDRPLLVGEAIRRSLFSSLTPTQAASLMACMAADPERSFGEMQISDEMLDIINDFDEIAYDVSKVEWRHSVTPSPELNLSAGAAAEMWAQGVTWDELVRRTKAEEGDLVRLLSRTGEALRQVGNLSSSNPEVSKIAREASDSVLRDPIR